MQTRLGAVLFDFDGVIVNSEPVHFRAFRAAAESEGIDLTEQQYYQELIGCDDAGAWRRVFELHDRPLDERTLRRIMSTKFAMMRQLLQDNLIEPLPGARELVLDLSPRLHLAICSAAVRDEVTAMLGGLGLESHFKVITCAEDVAIGKPDPSGYLLTLQRLSEKIGRDLRPAESLVIEDAPAVLRSVKSVGFQTLGVATSYPLEALSHADWAVRTLHRSELETTIPHLLNI